MLLNHPTWWFCFVRFVIFFRLFFSFLFISANHIEIAIIYLLYSISVISSAGLCCWLFFLLRVQCLCFALLLFFFSFSI